MTVERAPEVQQRLAHLRATLGDTRSALLPKGTRADIQFLLDELQKERDGSFALGKLAGGLEHALRDANEMLKMLDEELQRVSALLVGHSETSHSTCSAHLADVLREAMEIKADAERSFRVEVVCPDCGEGLRVELTPTYKGKDGVGFSYLAKCETCGYGEAASKLFEPAVSSVATPTPLWLNDHQGCSVHGLTGSATSCEACYPSVVPVADPVEGAGSPEAKTERQT